MMKIQDAMEKNVIKFQVDDRIVDVAGSLRENKISGAPVMNKEGQLVGIITPPTLD